jgi:hypothetical protein
MEKRAEPWNVVRQRGELLANLFLEDLGASVWVMKGREDVGPFDLIAFFPTDEQKLRVAGVKVRATQEPVGKEYRFQAGPETIRALQHSNVPVLILVVNVKRNEIFYGWAREVRCESSSSAKGKQKIAYCTLPVVAAAEGKEELLSKILSQPEFSERAGVG